MGIKIYKPEVYLGRSKILVNKISKLKKEVIDNKIGSNVLHVEYQKNIFEMALHVAKKVLKKKRLKLSFLIFVCQGQDNILPSTGERLAYNLGLNKNVLVLSISAGCSGFVQAIAIANKLLAKHSKNGLIVCAEKYSKYISKKDLKTKILFSDASSATLVKYIEKKNYIFEDFGTEGNSFDALIIKKNKLFMNGQKIFLFGINNVPRIIRKISKKIKIEKYLIHPGSKIMLDKIIEKSLIKKSDVFNSFNVTGNTVSSSIPLLISLNYQKLKGKKVLMTGFGVGLSWATLVLKWL